MKLELDCGDQALAFNPIYVQRRANASQDAESDSDTDDAIQPTSPEAEPELEAEPKIVILVD